MHLPTTRPPSLLYSLSLETLELVVNRLKSRHLLRLYATGCKPLQLLLQNLRRRKYVELRSTANSQLITALLVNKASSVVIDWANIRNLPLLDSASKSNIRELTIADRRLQPMVDELFNNVMDRLTMLETLNVYDIALPVQATLPPTLTSVTLHVPLQQNSSHCLHQLPLTHLGIVIKPRDERTFNWMSTASWYTTLTSLSLQGKCGSASSVCALAEHLPRNLLVLKVGDGCGLPTNLGELTSNLAHLQRLSAGLSWHIGGSNLPPMLTRLSLLGVTVAANGRIMDTLPYMPPSVTSLRLRQIRVNRNPLKYVPDDLLVFTTTILPRLDLKSAMRLVSQLYRLRVLTEVGRTSAEQLLVAKLKREGYSERHLNWLHDKKLSTHVAADDHSISLLFKCGIGTPEDVSLFLKHKRKFFASTASVCQCGDHYSTAVKCLEWDLCRHFAFTENYPPDLSESALSRLTKLVVAMTHTDNIAHLFGKYSFPSVTKLIISVPRDVAEQRKYMTVIIGIVKKHHSSFPILSKIEFPFWYYRGAPLGAPEVAALASIRFVPVPDSCTLVYTTKLPPPLPTVD